MENKTSVNKYLDILQIYRGIAALMILFHHSINSLEYYHKIDNEFLRFISFLGKYGVDFFFVLSGFIIAYSSFYKNNQPSQWKNYFKNRMLRIYIPYLPIGIVMFILYTQMPGFSNSDRDISTLTTLFLIPDGNPALSVAWSLLFELMFYFVFSFYFLSKALWHWFIVIWGIVILITNYYFLAPNLEIINPFLNLFMSMYNLEFIVGYIVTLLVLKGYKMNFSLLLTLLITTFSVFLFFVFNQINPFYFSLNILFSIVTFLLIYMSVTFYTKRIAKTALFMLIGNATYSIYLVHNPIQSTIVRFFPKINSYFSIFAVLLIITVVSCIVGYIYYLIFEKYVTNKIKSHLIK